MPNKDNVFLGLGIGLFTLIVSALLLATGVYFYKGSWLAEPKIFLFSFVVPLLISRYYIKKKQYMRTAGALIAVLLVAMVLYLIWLHEQQVI